MSYPQSVFTGNVVLLAALELEEAERTGAVTMAGAHRLEAARNRLRAATREYRAAITTTHTQGPDIDADLEQRQREGRAIEAVTHDGTRWVLQ